jgi:hypothetical protein
MLKYSFKICCKKMLFKRFRVTNCYSKFEETKSIMENCKFQIVKLEEIECETILPLELKTAEDY